MSVDEKQHITRHWMNVLTWMIKIIQHRTQNIIAILQRHSHIHYLSNPKYLSLDLDFKSEMVQVKNYHCAISSKIGLMNIYSKWVLFSRRLSFLFPIKHPPPFKIFVLVFQVNVSSHIFGIREKTSYREFWNLAIWSIRPQISIPMLAKSQRIHWECSQ